MSDSHFNMNEIKVYLDEVLADEEYLKTYKDVADDIYRVFNNLERLSVRDVESYLRGLGIGVAFDTTVTEKLAKKFARDISSLTCGNRSTDDVYWWALATGIWTYGSMVPENPQYRGRK